MGYTDLTAKQAEEFLQQPDAIVIDIRDAYIFNTSHIPGALHIDGPTMSNLILKRKKNPPVLIYCYHGNSSRDIAEMISGFGFDNVHNLVGGWEAWSTYKNQSENNFSTFSTQLSNAMA